MGQGPVAGKSSVSSSRDRVGMRRVGMRARHTSTRQGNKHPTRRQAPDKETSMQIDKAVLWAMCFGARNYYSNIGVQVQMESTYLNSACCTCYSRNNRCCDTPCANRCCYITWANLYVCINGIRWIADSLGVMYSIV